MRPLVFNLVILFAGMQAKAGSYPAKHVPGKIISISIDENGRALMGRDTLALEQLTTELQKRLWKSYTGTGKMYDAIHLQFTEQVLMGVRGSAMDAIKQAQKNALIEICLEKHKKLFDALSPGQQKRIEKQFPVLFQLNYQ
jgi:biopolymer transport protein ExbD